MKAEQLVLDRVTTIGEGPRTGVPDSEVTIIGAGPYGLSAAAHLKAAGIDVRVFGKPMDFWADKMPAGMLLRSPRVASSISDPASSHTLDAFEQTKGLTAVAPVPLETFVGYGQWFQHELVSKLDPRQVARLEMSQGKFQIALNDGVTFRSKRVVVAAGIGPFQKIPEVFRALPSALCTHCYSGFDVASFRGKKVVVIGAGQSSLESAALLHEAGAEVELVARINQLRWIGQHPWLHRLGPISATMYSKHDIGPAGVSRLVAYPKLMRQLPLGLRDKIRTRAVRSAGSAWLPARLKGVKIKTGCVTTEARLVGSKAKLEISDGSISVVDHVILGTGYSVDISRYEFLSPAMVKQIDVFDGYPVLSSGLESSLPGLHFLGAPAARTFGPLYYFVTGTERSSLELTAKIKGKVAVSD